MKLSDFDYELDENLIAQMPSQKRENSRLMHLIRSTNTIEHKHFYNIVDILDDNDFLVLNNTKVIPARIFGVCRDRHFEVTLHKNIKLNTWLAFIRNSRKYYRWLY